MANYQKMISQNQLLRKNLTNEKIAHENTLNQLDSTHQMNSELQTLLKNQQQNNKQLKLQVHNQNHRLQELSYQYQTQMQQLKELIDVKDTQIRRAHQVLNITDYDMIRIRVLNEVELSHQEELQQKNQQFRRIEQLLNQIKKKSAFNQEKIKLLEESIRKLEQQIQMIHQEYSKRQIKESNQYFTRLQEERESKRTISKQLDSIKKKYQAMTNHYENAMKAMQEDTYKANSGHQSKNAGGKAKGQLEQQLRVIRNKFNISDQENTLLRQQLRSQKKQMKKLLDDLQKKNSALLRQIQLLRTQFAEKQQTWREQIKSVEKENYKKHANLSSRDQQLQKIETQNRKLKQQIKLNQKQYQEKIKSFSNTNTSFNQIQFRDRQKSKKLQVQNSKLRQELQELKNKQGKSPVQRDHSKKRAESSLKNKLQQANSQIVTLLKQKIELKRQLAIYS